MAKPGVWQTLALGGMTYDLLLPDGYTPGQSYPVLLFLHGGTQAILLPGLVNPWFNTAAFRSDYPAIVIAPHLVTTASSPNWGGYGIGDLANQNQALAILAAVRASTVRIRTASTSRVSAWAGMAPGT